MASAIKAYSGVLTRDAGGTVSTTIYTAPAGTVGRAYGTFELSASGGGTSSASAAGISIGSVTEGVANIQLSDAPGAVVILPPGTSLVATATVSGSGSANVIWSVVVIEELVS